MKTNKLTNPQVRSDRQSFDATTFDGYAALYEEIFTWPYRSELEIPMLKTLLGDVSGKAVLDFGCGPGTFTRWLKRLGARQVVGYDISEGMLSYARNREEIEQAGLIYTSDISRYEQQFDIVLAVYVMPYAPDRLTLTHMVRDMADVLKPGGRLITLPLNPAFHPDPDYYRPYGIRLLGQQERLDDGSTVTLHLCHPPYDIQIEACYWTRLTLEDTLRAEGIGAIEWVTYDAVQSKCSSFLLPYAQCPHAAIITGEKSQSC